MFLRPHVHSEPVPSSLQLDRRPRFAMLACLFRRERAGRRAILWSPSRGADLVLHLWGSCHLMSLFMKRFMMKKYYIYIYVYDHIYTYTIIVVWFWHVLYGNALYAVSESHQHLKTYMCTFTTHKRPPKPELSIYSMHANSFLGFTRWTLEQIYVTKVLVETAIPNGLQANKKGGCTITVRKRGGWKDSFLMAQKIAGWI